MKTRFENVWDAIEETPALAENMKLRSEIMLALKKHIRAEGLSQKGVSIRVRRITSAMDLQAFALEAMGALCAARAVDWALAAHSFLAYG